MKKTSINIVSAAEEGDIDFVKLAIENGIPVDTGTNGWTALAASIYNDYLDIADYLIEHGADVNVKDDQGETILSWASLNGHDNYVKYLIKNHANLNLQNNDGETALMKATLNEKKEVVHLLLESGADPDIKNNSSNSARNIAKENGNKAIFDMISAYSENKILAYEIDINAEINAIQTSSSDHLIKL